MTPAQCRALIGYEVDSDNPPGRGVLVRVEDDDSCIVRLNDEEQACDPAHLWLPGGGR